MPPQQDLGDAANRQPQPMRQAELATIPPLYPKLALLEPLTVFTLIMLYIWKLRATHAILWIAIPLVMLLSHLLRRETPSMLGFRAPALPYRARWFVPLLAILGSLTLVCGALLRILRPINLEGAVLAFAANLPWGLLQQYMMNGYFLNRFDALLSPRAASLLTAALFCSAHTPNWFLMSVTFLGGYWSTQVYRKCQCLYLLGLAHAIAGFLLLMLVPDSVTHHLRVGPGWFKW